MRNYLFLFISLSLIGCGEEPACTKIDKGMVYHDTGRNADNGCGIYQVSTKYLQSCSDGYESEIIESNGEKTICIGGGNGW